jgi:ribose 1,5-bisphosphate isomerase
LHDVLVSSKFKNKEDFYNFTKEAAKKIKNARPTEPMLFNGLRYCLYVLETNKNKNLRDFKKAVVNSLAYYLDLMHEASVKVIKNGVKVIKNNEDVLIHCHSSSVVKTLILAKKMGKKFTVVNTETRPLFQGRLTAMELHKNNIDFTMIVDSEAPYFISPASGDQYEVERILIGCDAIGMSGSIINKVGSYSIALAGKTFKKPLYVSGSLLKCDVNDNIPVESRDFKEIWEKAPKGIKLLNFAFDLVPTNYITGIITEFGVIKPKDVKKIVKEKYPWMFDK